jgi:hypothetical protein
MVAEFQVMLSGVLVGRRVATSDVAAVEAHPEMDPSVSRLQTFFAAGDLVRDGQDLDPLEMFTPWHGFPFSSV